MSDYPANSKTKDRKKFKSKEIELCPRGEQSCALPLFVTVIFSDLKSHCISTLKIKHRAWILKNNIKIIPTRSFWVKCFHFFAAVTLTLDHDLETQMRPTCSEDDFWRLPRFIFLLSYINFWSVVFKILYGQTDAYTPTDAAKNNTNQ